MCCQATPSPAKAAPGRSVRAPGHGATIVPRTAYEWRTIMWWYDCWQKLTRAAGRRQRYAPPARRCVPRLEALEDRSVPSAGYTFATLPQPPSTGTLPLQGAFGINNAGDIVGEYWDANFVSHGYLY